MIYKGPCCGSIFLPDYSITKQLLQDLVVQSVHRDVWFHIPSYCGPGKRTGRISEDPCFCVTAVPRNSGSWIVMVPSVYAQGCELFLYSRWFKQSLWKKRSSYEDPCYKSMFSSTTKRWILFCCGPISVQGSHIPGRLSRVCLFLKWRCLRIYCTDPWFCAPMFVVQSVERDVSFSFIVSLTDLHLKIMWNPGNPFNRSMFAH